MKNKNQQEKKIIKGKSAIQQQKELQSQNNNIVIDLMIKTNKIISVLDNLLHLNNKICLNSVILEPENYNKVQENILNGLEILTEKVLELIKETTKDNEIEKDK